MQFQLPFRPAAWLFLAACALGFSCQLKKYEDVGCPAAAAFRVENDGCAGPCNITVINETIGDDNLLSYDWNFGDSTTSTEKNPPAHFYNQFGNYFITLKVSMANCGTLEKTIKVSIKDPGHPLPVAAFSMDKTVVSVGETVQFTNASTEEMAWHWSFGDGTTSELENPTHAYATADTFKVVLIAEGLGGFDTVTQEVRVRPKMWVKTYDVGASLLGEGYVRLVAEKGDGTFLFATSRGKTLVTGNVSKADGGLIGALKTKEETDFDQITFSKGVKTDNGFVLVGSANKPNEANFYAITLKPDFSISKNKEILMLANNGLETAKSAVQLTNGDFVFCGNRSEPDNVTVPDLGMLFIKTTANLDLPNVNHAFNNDQNNEATAILQISTGFAVVGRKISGTGVNEGVFFKLSNDLSVVLDSEEPIANEFLPVDMIALNGSFVVAGEQGNSSRILSLNSSGEKAGLLDEIIVDLHLNRAIPTSDGNIVVVGYSPIDGKNAGFLAKYSPSTGQMIWKRDFPLAGADRVFYSLAQLPDNGFLIGGHQNLPGGNNLALLIRTDSEGFID